MLKILIIALLSMFRSSERHPNRTWGEELLVRNFRLRFEAILNAVYTTGKFEMGDIPALHISLLRTKRTPTSIVGVPCTLIRPKTNGRPKRVVVYMHGGAYVMGSPQTHCALLAQLSVNSDALVIAVDYRLGPEHVYPAAYQDCYAVTKEILDRYSDTPVTMAGDSAGGALAIAVALSLDESSKSRPESLIAISPWIDPLAEGGTMLSNAPYDYLTQSDLAFCYRNYIGDADPANPATRLVSVGLTKLPRTYMQYGDAEIFHDQVKAFCDRALEYDVEIVAERFSGQAHVFQLLSPLTSTSRLAMRKIATFIGQDKHDSTVSA